MNESRYQKLKEDLYRTQYNPNADWFTAQLYRLFQKADSGNRRRLAIGFPEHYQVWLDWYTAPNEREFFAEFLNEGAR